MAEVLLKVAHNTEKNSLHLLKYLSKLVKVLCYYFFFVVQIKNLVNKISDFTLGFKIFQGLRVCCFKYQYVPGFLEVDSDCAVLYIPKRYLPENQDAR